MLQWCMWRQCVWVIAISVVLVAVGVEAADESRDRSGPKDERQIVAASEASGIEGQVSIRPVRPVERKGVPNQRPYQAQITVVDTAGNEVAKVDSNAEGKFRITLPPGTYVLRPESPGLYPRASEQRVKVSQNSVSRVEILYDSGLR
jgi:hypothetical protein